MDAALPELAPWQVMTGGAAGSCTFVGSGGPNIFGANQMLKASPAEATDLVLVSIIETDSADQVLQNTGGGCTREPVAELGPTGEMLSACQGGRPHAKVRYVDGNCFIEYSLAPGREPTRDELKLLIELARKAPARAS